MPFGVYTKNLAQPPLDYFAHQQELAAISAELKVSGSDLLAGQLAVIAKLRSSIVVACRDIPQGASFSQQTLVTHV